MEVLALDRGGNLMGNKVSMRDKIADILWESETRGGDSHKGLADDIIDALPYMVVPLVWPDFTSGQIYQSARPVIYGDCYNIKGTESTGFNAYYGENLISASMPDEQKAKAAAQAHHVTQMMAAFGVNA